ncbi:MAG: hypothetical protein ABI140_12645 [Jatrophihabitantaceae bacterium]
MIEPRLVGVASCPNPPLLLRGITGRPVAEVEQLRTSCLAAIAELLDCAPDLIVLVGGQTAAELAEPEPDKPLSITVGRLLLAQANAALPVEHLVVAGGAPTEQCLALGRQVIAETAGRVGLLVMADGSARRSVKAPGYLDERAAPFDAVIERALVLADPAALAGLDPALAAELLVAGRASWQVLAGAAESQHFAAQLHYADDPFGVWYPVASWRAL